jgi:ribokinase
VAAARIGAGMDPPVAVRMVGRVGDDDEGRRMLADLVAAGVDASGVLTDPVEPTGVALIMVDGSGENFIGVGPGANATVTAADAARAVGGLVPGDVLVCQLEIPLGAVEAAVAAAADRGAFVVCNAAPPVPLKTKGLSLLVVNETEASTVLGLGTHTTETVAAASAAHGCAIVVTLGGDGAIYAGPGAGSGRVLPPSVRAVDTTGAGDTFVGACAVRLAAGASLRDAVTAGVAAGAFAVTRPGARNAPDATELANLLAGMPTATPGA